MGLSCSGAGGPGNDCLFFQGKTYSGAGGPGNNCLFFFSRENVDLHAESGKGGDPGTIVCLHRPETPSPRHCPTGIYPPAFFFPGPVHLFPPGEEGRGRRGNDTDTDTTRWRRPEAPCHHHAQGVSVNPFGYPPLSDIPIPPPMGIRERGMYLFFQ